MQDLDLTPSSALYEGFARLLRYGWLRLNPFEIFGIPGLDNFLKRSHEENETGFAIQPE